MSGLNFTSKKIGIVGSGGIVQSGHLPSYRTAGFSVAAIFDTNYERASSVAREFGIAKVCGELGELLEDPAIDVVDIAVPAAHQPAIVLAALQYGKHLLCQKPLAVTHAEAEPLVHAAEASRVKLAVNVNMRWEPAMREAARLIRQGDIGELCSTVFEVKYYENWASWPWLVPSSRLVLLYDAIHILDIVRTLMGEPQAVESRYGRGADDEVAGETWADAHITFGGGRSARLDEDSRMRPEETSVTFRFEGDTGLITGMLGLYYDYPVGRADSIKLVPKGMAEERVPMQTLPGRWIPDAFSETMRVLLTAIETGAEPENSGDDHLKTLRLVDSIYDASRMEIRKHRQESR